MYMDVLLAYICIPWICLVPVAARKGHPVPWSWRYRWLWVLGIKPGSSGRAVCVLKPLTSPPAPKNLPPIIYLYVRTGVCLH